MRKVIVNEWMTLDGVVQAPISPAEDRDGDFEHGGWHTPHAGDSTFQQWMFESITGAGGYLLGRRTYENLAAYWPNAPEAEEALAQPLNTRPKYVASTTLRTPLAWQNSTVLEGSIAEAVAALKMEEGGNLLVFGSTVLVHSLMEHGLVDELRLMIDPVLVGGGKRIFQDDRALRQLRLVEGQVTGTGAFLATYERSIP